MRNAYREAGAMVCALALTRELDIDGPARVGRAPDAGLHARRAHDARADVDLDDVGAGLDERARALGGAHVARDDGEPRGDGGADGADRLEHAALVAVGGVMLADTIGFPGTRTLWQRLTLQVDPNASRRFGGGSRTPRSATASGLHELP